MITPDDALALVLERVRPLPAIDLPLERALGSRLARSVRADRDLPPADRAAMDGYAVRAADLADPPARLRLAGEVSAGSRARPRIRPGTCARIATGANLPPGADAVVMLERSRERGDEVLFRGKIVAGANVFRRGEDARKGEVLLGEGVRLEPARIGLCAAAGKPTLRVHRAPRVAIICTGGELRGAGEAVASCEQRDSNGPMLQAALAQAGFADATCRRVADDPARIARELSRLSNRGDAVLLSGGLSAGGGDHVRTAVLAVGARIRFHGGAMKPGKPVLYATLPGNRHLFGLPGNPLSAMAAFHELALPALARLAGAPATECRPAIWLPLAAAVAGENGRVRLHLARVEWGPVASVQPLHLGSMADLVTGGRAHGVIVAPAGARRIQAGTLVEFRPWTALP